MAASQFDPARISERHLSNWLLPTCVCRRFLARRFMRCSVWSGELESHDRGEGRSVSGDTEAGNRAIFGALRDAV